MKHMMALKEGSLDIIKKAKGWKNDTEAAEALGFTRQYICALKQGKMSCTQEVIIRFAIVLGNIKGKWWSHFEIVETKK